MKTHYDYLIVGAGLFGATFAYRATKMGKSCLVIDKRPHLGGNVFCENIEGINVHKYGAHIFHTNDKQVWDFVNSLVPFNRYTNSPVANYKGKLYNLPFNMNTFYQMWGVTTPARRKRNSTSKRPRPLPPCEKPEWMSHATLRNRLFCSLAKTSTSGSSRVTPRNNGDDPAPNCRHSSSSACRCGSPSTTTISTTSIRAFRSGDTTNSSTDY